MVKTKKLKNLVWVWDIQDFKSLSADAENYNPGSDYWDIAALDVYDDGSSYSKEKYDIMVKAAGNKPMAIGECQKYPAEVDLLHGLVGARVRPQQQRTTAKAHDRRQHRHPRPDARLEITVTLKLVTHVSIR
jgi:hypothetical protein